MSILWCGGEDIDFPTFTGCSMSSSSGGNYRSGYSRGYIYVAAGGAKSTPFPGGAITSGWMSFRLNASLGNGNICVGLGDSDTAKSGLYVAGTQGAYTKLALIKYDGKTKTELATEAGTSLSGLVKIDLHLTNYGANATVDVYVNGSIVISYGPGDVTVSGVSSLDSVFLGYAGSSSTYSVTEIIVADTDTRNLSLITHYPNGAGDTLNWTGAYTTIDELAIDDSDLAYDNTDGNQAMYNLSATPAGTFSVVCVKEAVRACRASDSTPTSLDIGVKSGGSVDVNSNHSLTTAWATYERYMTANPITSAAFSTAEMDSLQLVLESEA